MTSLICFLLFYFIIELLSIFALMINISKINLKRWLFFSPQCFHRVSLLRHCKKEKWKKDFGGYHFSYIWYTYLRKRKCIFMLSVKHIAVYEFPDTCNFIYGNLWVKDRNVFIFPLYLSTSSHSSFFFLFYFFLSFIFFLCIIFIIPVILLKLLYRNNNSQPTPFILNPFHTQLSIYLSRTLVGKR